MITQSSFESEVLLAVIAQEWETCQIRMNTDGSIRIHGRASNVGGSGCPERTLKRSRFVYNELESYFTPLKYRHRLPLLLRYGYDTPTTMRYALQMLNVTEMTMPVLLDIASRCSIGLHDFIHKCTARKKEFMCYALSRAGFATMTSGGHIPIKKCLESMIFPDDDLVHYFTELVHCMRGDRTGGHRLRTGGLKLPRAP
jgi:hypothetical protein